MSSQPISLPSFPVAPPLAELPATPPFTVPLAQVLNKLFSDEERVIVLTMNPEGHLTSYEVKPLAEIVAMLALHGFGQTVPLPSATPPRPHASPLGAPA